MAQASAGRVVARGAVRKIAYGCIAVLGAVCRLRQRRPPVDSVDRILVIRIDLLGDLLFTRPLITALRDRFPEASISLLTLPYTSSLGKHFGEVDEHIVVDTNRIRTVRGLVTPGTWREYARVLRVVRSRKFDVAISVCGRMASLCAFLAGARRSIGYQAEEYPFLLNDTVPGGRYEIRQHEVEYVRGLARHLGIESPPAVLQLESPHSGNVNAETLLRSVGIAESSRFVAIHAGAVNGSAKRWPSANWARFARRVIDELGVAVVLVGAASDEPIAREVLRESGPGVASLVGKTSVDDLLGVLQSADLVASGDSGPLHLAVALGRPLLAAYGPTDPYVHGPYHPSQPVSVHRADIPCSPCFSMAASAECPLGDPICMRLVTVDSMVEGARQLLMQPDGI